MTLQEWDTGQVLLNKIERKKELVDAIDALIGRINDTTTEVMETVEIQLAEAYTFTPKAMVDIDTFKDFLDIQKTQYNLDIQRLREEFEKL